MSFQFHSDSHCSRYSSKPSNVIVSFLLQHIRSLLNRLVEENEERLFVCGYFMWTFIQTTFLLYLPTHLASISFGLTTPILITYLYITQVKYYTLFYIISGSTVVSLFFVLLLHLFLYTYTSSLIIIPFILFYWFFFSFIFYSRFNSTWIIFVFVKMWKRNFSLFIIMSP